MPSRSHGLNSPQLWGPDDPTWARPSTATPPRLAAAPEGGADPGLGECHPGATGLVLLLSIGEAGKALGVCRTKVYELIGRGDLEVVHIDRSARVPVDSIHDYVDRLRTCRQGRRG